MIEKYWKQNIAEYQQENVGSKIQILPLIIKTNFHQMKWMNEKFSQFNASMPLTAARWRHQHVWTDSHGSRHRVKILQLIKHCYMSPIPFSIWSLKDRSSAIFTIRHPVFFVFQHWILIFIINVRNTISSVITETIRR